MAVSEKTFQTLVRDRLIDTEQVRQMLGVKTPMAITHRINKGWYSGPIVVRDKGYSLWDRVQVEREEKARLAAVAKKIQAKAA